MSNTPVSPAREEALSGLKTLIGINYDAQEGFATAAQHATDPSLKQFFTEYALERATMTADLQLLERQHGQPDPDGDGTLLGTLHRTWINLRSGLSTDSDLALLEEAERGEDAALAAYQEALTPHEIPLPRSITSVLERHLNLVKRAHDEVRHRRDEARAAS